MVVTKSGLDKCFGYIIQKVESIKEIECKKLYLFGGCGLLMYDICNEGGMLILETHTDMLIMDRPALAFYPEKECNNDPGTWFGPNPKCVGAMLKAAGFKDVQNVYQNDASHRVVFHAIK